jgi:hypothetical protein
MSSLRKIGDFSLVKKSFLKTVLSKLFARLKKTNLIALICCFFSLFVIFFLFIFPPITPVIEEPIETCDVNYMPGNIVNYNDIAKIEGYLYRNPQIVEKISSMNWFFSHASIGKNILKGLKTLNRSKPNLYSLTVAV